MTEAKQAEKEKIASDFLGVKQETMKRLLEQAKQEGIRIGKAQAEKEWKQAMNNNLKDMERSARTWGRKAEQDRILKLVDEWIGECFKEKYFDRELLEERIRSGYISKIKEPTA